MTTDKWTLNFREFELALEGTLGNELTQIQEYLENELVNAQNIGLERASISVGEDNSRTILAEVDFVEQINTTNFESLNIWG